MTTILLAIIALALLPAALAVVAKVLPGLLKVAFVVGCVIGLLFLASWVAGMVPDVVWVWAVMIVVVGGFTLLVVATVWDVIKSLRHAPDSPPVALRSFGLQRRRPRSRRKLSRQELLDAVTRYRVFQARGIEDQENKEGASTDHGFSESDIAQNALAKWQVDLASAKKKAEPH
jgi:hypothetical protein